MADKNFFKTNAGYIMKAFIWLFGNACFGLVPFLVIKLLNSLSLSSEEISIASKESIHLLRDCAIMFASCVIMGAVFIDFVLSKVKAKKHLVLLITFPVFAVLSLVGLVYVLLLIDKIDDEGFAKVLVLQEWIGVFTLFYAISIKPILYKKEDLL